MQDADTGDRKTLDGEGLRIGIVRARFNDAITRRLEEACLAELAALGVQDKHVTRVDVPGALEVPLALKMMADSEDYDALVALGCVIRGETYHFELVANESGAGVTRVGLDKGRDAARVAVEMANLMEDF
jgi:6,7-dimethyl-8-ribityllumazine synthase